mgnify:FL=1
MLSEKDYLAAREHFSILREEADRARIANQRPARPHFYWQALSRLGSYLVERGRRLEERYSVRCCENMAAIAGD